MKSNTERSPSGPSVLVALQRATHVTLRRLATELADLRLTSSEINALANLADDRMRTLTELGESVGVKPTTLTGVLDRLERRGYVVRVASPHDRRALRVELTAAGRVAADQVDAAFEAVERRALRDLPATSVVAFHEVARALAQEPS